jgi:hypothetical protein
VTSIGYDAFYNCTGLTGITIPSGVTSISHSAFDGCTGLESITVDAGNQNYASYGGILYNKAKTEIIFVLDGISGSITIPDSVTSIGNYAFDACTGLTDITIPDSVTSIGNDTFSHCTGLTDITIPNSVITINIGAFFGCYGLTGITIPNSVTSIGNVVFYGCTSLTDIYFTGTQAEWNAISKTDAYIPAAATIHCTDGDI